MNLAQLVMEKWMHSPLKTSEKGTVLHAKGKAEWEKGSGPLVGKPTLQTAPQIWLILRVDFGGIIRDGAPCATVPSLSLTMSIVDH